MLLDLELGALNKYLNPSKAKLEAKNVQTASASVLNLKEIVPTINHEGFCDAMQKAFTSSVESLYPSVNVQTLDVPQLE